VLGRYGNRIDPGGWVIALRELARILRPGRRVHLGVPVGRQRLRFIVRASSIRTIIEAVPTLRLVDLHAVDDSGKLIERPNVDALARASSSDRLFEFTTDPQQRLHR
jgi:hypothetical protein